ncbi:MAG: hypothetical protein Q7R45_15565 [Sulfuricaulis sp.]|nr:hypothetical protein [Sulfuricaulis sp.]
MNQKPMGDGIPATAQAVPGMKKYRWLVCAIGIIQADNPVHANGHNA